MDVGPPDVDGREAVQFCARTAFKAPIIMLTGHDTDSPPLGLNPAPMTMWLAAPHGVLVARISRAAASTRRARCGGISPLWFRPSPLLLLTPGTRLLDEKRPRSCATHRAEARYREITAARSAGLQLRRHPHTSTIFTAASKGRKDAAMPSILVTESGGYKLVP
jgi:hypothetical protein